MAYLKHRSTGAVTEDLSPDGQEYQALKSMRFASQVSAVAAPSGTSGLVSGETSGVLAAGSPVWEDIAEEDATGDPAGGRVLVFSLGSTAAATDEVTSDEKVVQVPGTLTDVEYVADPNSSGITGQATNNRTVTLQEITLSGTTTPTRAVTALAAVTFGSGVNALPGVPVALTISQAAFTANGTLQVTSAHNGTGLADPGGVVYAVYTRA